MAQTKNGKLFYEVTKEKPIGKSHVLLTGGSVGAVVSFFMVSVLGSLCAVAMDDWVFYFILASLIGFGVGALLTWLFVRTFAKVATAAEVEMQVSEIQQEDLSKSEVVAEPVAAGEEDKGQSVDFVFPELSPDK